MMEQEMNMNFELPTQLPTTASTLFGTCDSLDQPFYTVREGIPLEDALLQISLLLKYANESAYELTDGDQVQRGLVWSALHQMESAKAITDALIDGLSLRRRALI